MNCRYIYTYLIYVFIAQEHLRVFENKVPFMVLFGSCGKDYILPCVWSGEVETRGLAWSRLFSSNMTSSALLSEFFPALNSCKVASIKDFLALGRDWMKLRLQVVTRGKLGFKCHTPHGPKDWGFESRFVYYMDELC